MLKEKMKQAIQMKQEKTMNLFISSESSKSVEKRVNIESLPVAESVYYIRRRILWENVLTEVNRYEQYLSRFKKDSKELTTYEKSVLTIQRFFIKSALDTFNKKYRTNYTIEQAFLR